MFLWCRKNSKELVFPVFLATFGPKKFLEERIFPERETNKERSQRDFELTFINPHNNNIIIREHEC